MAASLREISLPRFTMRRDEAAASLSISSSTFDTWVREGKMPRGHKIGALVLWDTEEVRQAWQRLRDADSDDSPNPFDQVVA